MFNKKECNSIKIFRFLKQIFISTLVYFSSLSIVNPLECISVKNQECKVRHKIVDVSSNNPIFYPFVIILLIHMQEFAFQILLKV